MVAPDIEKAILSTQNSVDHWTARLKRHGLAHPLVIISFLLCHLHAL